MTVKKIIYSMKVYSLHTLSVTAYSWTNIYFTCLDNCSSQSL